MQSTFDTFQAAAIRHVIVNNPAVVRAAINESIREHIRSAGSQLCSIVFYKKDGTLRRCTVNLAAMPARVKGTERGARASATRAQNYPFLMTVWDIHKRDFRSVNLDTVLTVRTSGKTTRYRRLSEFADPIAMHVGGARYVAPVIAAHLSPVLVRDGAAFKLGVREN